MAVNESARAAGIDLAHVVRDIVGDEVRVELQRQLGGLSDRERRILDMWPRYEDGEPVMIGDGVDGLDGEIIEVYIAENAAAIWNNFANHMHLSPGERVKRPAPEVLDADGVPIKVDDTVWHEDGSELRVIGFGGAQDGETMLVVEYAAGPTKWGEVRCLSVTHTRPDSWERLEEDAESIRQIIACNFGDFSPSDFKQSGDSLQDRVSGLVRRAKALAGVEVAG